MLADSQILSAEESDEGNTKLTADALADIVIEDIDPGTDPEKLDINYKVFSRTPKKEFSTLML